MRRLQLAQDRLGINGADVRVVDRLQRVDDVCALRGGQQRRMLDGRVGVRRDVAQQRFTERARLIEIFDVAVVQ
jgi:hypothetical protein